MHTVLNFSFLHPRVIHKVALDQIMIHLLVLLREDNKNNTLNLLSDIPPPTHSLVRAEILGHSGERNVSGIDKRVAVWRQRAHLPRTSSRTDAREADGLAALVDECGERAVVALGELDRAPALVVRVVHWPDGVCDVRRRQLA